MADKVQLIKEEIERRIKNLEFSLENNCVEKHFKLDILGNITTLESLLQFIESIPEHASEDLEEEYDNYFKKHEIDIVLNPYTNCKDIARHFAEWQRKKDEKLFKEDSWNYIEEYYPDITKEEKLRLYDVSIKSRLAGANTIKQKMAKDVFIDDYIVHDGRIELEGDPLPSVDPIILLPYPNFKPNDKVKIIIVKEEQK